MSVDTERLRALLGHVVKAEALERLTGEVIDHVSHTHDDTVRCVEASRAATSARREFHGAVRFDLPALLDELEAARKLLTEVRDHGLADFDPTARRIDLTRRVAAFVGE